MKKVLAVLALVLICFAVFAAGFNFAAYVSPYTLGFCKNEASDYGFAFKLSGNYVFDNNVYTGLEVTAAEFMENDVKEGLFTSSAFVGYSFDATDKVKANFNVGADFLITATEDAEKSFAVTIGAEILRRVSEHWGLAFAVDASISFGDFFNNVTFAPMIGATYNL